MSRPLICDNPGCETIVDADLLADLAEERNERQSTLPVGWVTVSEVDTAGDDVVVGECCSRTCAAALITIGHAEESP